MVGLFVIAGMALIIILVLWVGMSAYFQQGQRFVSFFDESVQGLTPDSAVNYRGVNVGKVISIGVAPDGRLVQIVFTLENKMKNPGTLFATLKAVGLTGLMYIELDRIKAGEKIQIPKFTFTPEYPVIATKPSQMKQLLTDLYGILSQIKTIDIKGISERVQTMLENINEALGVRCPNASTLRHKKHPHHWLWPDRDRAGLRIRLLWHPGV